MAHENLYSEEDYKISREGIRRLDIYDQFLLHLRFWENHSIEEIADLAGLSWNEVNERINDTLLQLKATLLDHSGFSRSENIGKAAS